MLKFVQSWQLRRKARTLSGLEARGPTRRISHSDGEQQAARPALSWSTAWSCCCQDVGDDVIVVEEDEEEDDDDDGGVGGV